jgi:DMSO/TMAO reductase YedYZ heme-binding membrane subunit
MPGRKPKNTWVLLVSGVAALALVAGVVSIDSLGLPINVVLRPAALLGYLMVFLSTLSSNYMRELTKFFGRPFPKVHHIVTVTALVALAIHAISVAWRSGTLAVFVPQFSSAYAFFSLGGRMAFWLLAVTSLTALFKASIGKSWKTIHWLNYVVFLLGTVHALLLGPNIQHWAVRVILGLMAVVAVVVFVLKRFEERRRRMRRARA